MSNVDIFIQLNLNLDLKKKMFTPQIDRNHFTLLKINFNVTHIHFISTLTVNYLTPIWIKRQFKIWIQKDIFYVINQTKYC